MLRNGPDQGGGVSRWPRWAIGGLAASAMAVLLPRVVMLGDRWRHGDTADAPPVGPPGDMRSHAVRSQDGTQLAVFEQGAGRPIVLLHGVGLTHEVWYPQFIDLSGRYRVVALDIRGHGESQSGATGYGPTLFAADVAAVLEGLDLRDAVLVGHSLGGTAVGQFCADYPAVLNDRVGALVFVGTFASALIGEGWWREHFGRHATRLATGLQRGRKQTIGPPSGALAYLTARYAFGADPRPSQIRRTLEISTNTPPSVAAECTVQSLDYDVRAQLGGVMTPALVVSGDRDRLSTARSSQRLFECLGNARHVILEDAGHMPMYERRRQLSELIDEIASSTGASPPTSTRC